MLCFVSGEKRLPGGNREPRFQISPDETQPARGVHLNRYIEKTSSHMFLASVEIKRQITLRMTVHNFESAYQGNMPFRICSLNILRVRIFESDLIQAFLKILELGGRPHFGNAKNFRTNLFDDSE